MPGKKDPSGEFLEFVVWKPYFYLGDIYSKLARSIKSAQKIRVWNIEYLFHTEHTDYYYY